MKKIYFSFSVTLVTLSFSVLGQTNPNQQMQTFSPYTPEQLKAFNDQRISPMEGAFGPVGPNQQEINLQQRSRMNSKFFNVPTGEQQAEAIETESAEPYQPMTPAISF